MPNVERAEAFIADATALEQRLVATVQQRWQRARYDLIDLVAARDTAIDGLQLTPPIRAAAVAMAAASDTITQPAVQLAADFLQDQLVRPVGIGRDELLPADPLSAYLAPWEASALAAFGAEISLLQSVGADAITIRNRLLAPSTMDGRASIWQRQQTLLQLAAEGALWALLNGTLRHGYTLADQRGPVRYQKQIIAQIDHRTTRTCLAAHGQIVSLDTPFHLEGGHASQMQQPPFHHRCRSVIVLYTPAMERIGPTTQELRATARAESARR